MMDELREVHLGIPRPDPDLPRASEQLRARLRRGDARGHRQAARQTPALMEPVAAPGEDRRL
jgi:hypothetical protein